MRHPSRLMAEALLARTREFAPEVKLVHRPLEPVAGAVFLALERSGAVVTAKVWDNLASSLPGEALFQTTTQADQPRHLEDVSPIRTNSS